MIGLLRNASDGIRGLFSVSMLVCLLSAGYLAIRPELVKEYRVTPLRNESQSTYHSEKPGGILAESLNLNDIFSHGILGGPNSFFRKPLVLPEVDFSDFPNQMINKIPQLPTKDIGKIVAKLNTVSIPDKVTMIMSLSGHRKLNSEEIGEILAELESLSIQDKILIAKALSTSFLRENLEAESSGSENRSTETSGIRPSQVPKIQNAPIQDAEEMFFFNGETKSTPAKVPFSSDVQKKAELEDSGVLGEKAATPTSHADAAVQKKQQPITSQVLYDGIKKEISFWLPLGVSMVGAMTGVGTLLFQIQKERGGLKPTVARKPFKERIQGQSRN
jgi:hypothetical protein